jgi:hypothetical protein
MERDAAFAAVPRLRVNFYFVNEHGCFSRQNLLNYEEFSKLNLVNSVFRGNKKSEA